MLLSEALFRFGLPLGSALVLVGILDSAANLFSAWMDLGGVLIYHVNQSVKVDPVTVIWILIILVWNFSNLGILWIGVIIKGSSAMLMAWIVTTVVCGLIALIVWIYMVVNVWGYWLFFFSEVYAVLTYLLTTGYLLNVALQCLKALKAHESLEPLGKGVAHILKFYSSDPTLAAKFLLISELIIIAEYVFTRQVMEFAFDRGLSGHESDTSPGIVAEEYVIRALRFIISAVGIYFVIKGKVRELKFWGMVYGGAIGASTIIFIYLLFCWRSEHPLFTVGYFLTFVISLMYRSGILYCCLQVVRPYRSSNTFATLQET